MNRMNRTGTIRGGLIALFAMPLLCGMILTSCGEDPVDAGDYPITFRANEVEEKSDVKVYANNNGTWTEVAAGSTDLFTNPFFAESAAIEADDSGFVLISDSTWQIGGSPGTTYSYTIDDDRYEFLVALGIANFTLFADADGSDLDLHYAAAISVMDDGTFRSTVELRSSYDPDLDLIDQLAEDGSDTVAYQTFKIEYEAE